MTVNPAQTFQTIAGWEVTGNVDPHAGSNAVAEWRNYANAAVNQAGITRVRLEVRSGNEGQIGAYAALVNGGSDAQWNARRYPVINDNADPGNLNMAGFDFSETDRVVEYAVLPMQQAMAARGEKLKINVCYVSFLNGQRSVHEDPEEYAEFALAAMLHLRQKYGLEPDSWEVMLEPDNGEPYWDGQRIGRSIVAAGRRFDQYGIKARFVAPSTTNMANAPKFFDEMLTIPGAVDRVSELSYHRYRGVSDAALQDIQSRAQKYNLGSAMLEWWFGRGDRDVLFADLENGAVAFQGRALGGVFANGPTTGALQLNDEIRFNSLLWLAVRPGAVRVGASGSGPFDALAFRRPDGKYVVALNASGAGTATVRGLPQGSYSVSTVTASGSSGPVAASQGAGGDIAVSIGGAGMVVVQPAG